MSVSIAPVSSRIAGDENYSCDEKEHDNFSDKDSDPSVPQETQSKTIDAMLANDLNKLTFRERESINEEIHGINVDRKYIEESGACAIEEAGAFEETPQILTKSFHDLQMELDKLRSSNRGVGESAFGFNRSQELFGSTSEKETYLNTNELRIMFLRCERFDCQKAAKRLCGFANVMYELYGDVALERRIKLSDFDEADLAVIKEGRTQLFSGRDRAGRRIYAHYASHSWDRLSVETRLRYTFYVVMSCLENDVFSQRMGVVGIMWWHSIIKLDASQFIARGITTGRGTAFLPVRIGALHYCFPSLMSARNLAFVQIVSRMTSQLRPHMRIHSGSPMECIYVLESFGINTKQIPLNITTGALDLTSHNRWLVLCAAREEDSQLYNKIIECPNYTDILFGRGQVVMNHPGNIMYRNFIQSKLELYSNVGSKKESTQWTWGVVRTLKSEYGARFLKEERINSDVMAWVEVSNEIARSKVRIAFRDARTRLVRSMKEEAAKSMKEEAANTKSNNYCAFGTSGKSSLPLPSSSFISSTSTMLSKRKKFEISPPDDLLSSDIVEMTSPDGFGPFSLPSLSPLKPLQLQLQQQQQQQPSYNLALMDFGNINDNLNILSTRLNNFNENLSELNSNLNNLQQQFSNTSNSDSPTTFLGSADSHSISKPNSDFNTVGNNQPQFTDFASSSMFLGMDGSQTSQSKRQRMCYSNLFDDCK